jgi:RIO-like serine/threonine protein kinase
MGGAADGHVLAKIQAPLHQQRRRARLAERILQFFPEATVRLHIVFGDVEDYPIAVVEDSIFGARQPAPAKSGAITCATINRS